MRKNLSQGRMGKTIAFSLLLHLGALTGLHHFSPSSQMSQPQKPPQSETILPAPEEKVYGYPLKEIDLALHELRLPASDRSSTDFLYPKPLQKAPKAERPAATYPVPPAPVNEEKYLYSEPVVPKPVSAAEAHEQINNTLAILNQDLPKAPKEIPQPTLEELNKSGCALIPTFSKVGS